MAMISVATAVRNYLCRDCGATLNLRRLAFTERRTWFACGLCPDCVGQPAGHPVQLTLFEVCTNEETRT